jgi:hypothetical protein
VAIEIAGTAQATVAALRMTRRRPIVGGCTSFCS